MVTCRPDHNLLRPARRPRTGAVGSRLDCAILCSAGGALGRGPGAVHRRAHAGIHGRYGPRRAGPSAMAARPAADLLRLCPAPSRRDPGPWTVPSQALSRGDPGRAHPLLDANVAAVSAMGQACRGCPRSCGSSATVNSPTAAGAGVPRPGSWRVLPPERAEPRTGPEAWRRSRARLLSGWLRQTGLSPAPGS
jgi:hypothetical protein